MELDFAAMIRSGRPLLPTRALALGALAILLACSRPQPSPDYDRARQLWTSLVQSRGDAAAEDPRADEVLVLLDRVPKDSSDAAAAAELRGRIEGERKAHVEELARRQKLVAGAGSIPSVPAAPGGPAAEDVRPSRPAAPALVPGMKLEAFREGYGDCFESKGPVQLSSPDGGASRPAEMWVMKGDAACRDKHPQLAGQAALFAAGALVGMAPVASAKTVQVRRQVELAPLPDGGLGERVDGGVVPLPPGAEIIMDGGQR
jgi:hypothetical protein